MTRTVFDGSQTAHVWAQLSQPSGRSSNGSIYFEGRALYSYGSHYLAAFILENGDVLLNASKRSVTTSKHMSYAWRAVSHRNGISVPDLTSLAPLLTYQSTNKAACKAGARAYLAEVGTEISDESGFYIARLFGLPAASWPKIKREADAKAVREAKAYKMREERRDLFEAERVADITDAEFRALWPRDPHALPHRHATRRPYDWKAVDDYSKRLGRLLRIARAHKASKRRVETLARRVKEYREHAKGTEARVVAAIRNSQMARYDTWRASGGEAPPSWHYTDWAPEIAAIIDAANAEKREADKRATYDAWQRGEGKRPRPADWEDSSPEYAALRAAEAKELADTEAAYLVWRDDKSAPVPDDYPFLTGQPLASKYPDAWHVIYMAKAAAIAEAKRRDLKGKFDAWQAGEVNAVPAEFRTDANGGAYVRRYRDELQTSQGASVPWDDAVKAFRFIKLCRERGEAFKAKGRRVHVGHFNVDRITASGDMIAGCHRFSWAEIERLAKAQGVFDIAPSDSAVETA